RNSRSGVRFGLRPQPGASHAHRIRPLQFLWLRWNKRRPDLQEIFGVAVKILVCIKQAPARDSLLRINSASTWIQEDDLSFEINEPDAYALEAALQLKEQKSGPQGALNEVIALCAGPPRAAQTIREALAKGADRAIHVEQPDSPLVP